MGCLGESIVGPSQNQIDVTVSLVFCVFKVFSWIFFSAFKSKKSPGCTGEQPELSQVFSWLVFPCIFCNGTGTSLKIVDSWLDSCSFS